MASRAKKEDPCCLACCRPLSEHNAKRQCEQTTYFIPHPAPTTPDSPTPATAEGERTTVTRIIVEAALGVDSTFVLPEDWITHAEPYADRILATLATPATAPADNGGEETARAIYQHHLRGTAKDGSLWADVLWPAMRDYAALAPDTTPATAEGESLLARLKRIPMTEWVWADALDIFAALSPPVTAATDIGKIAQENGPVVVDWYGEELAWRPLDYGSWTPLATPATAPADIGGWIVGDGQAERWRIWEYGNPDWTTDRDKATRYARREDAEAVHREDEDAWRVVPYAALATATGGTFADGVEVVLAVLRGRKLLKYVFDREPDDAAAYGWLTKPIDLETQREIAEALVRALRPTGAGEVERAARAFLDAYDDAEVAGGNHLHKLAWEASNVLRATLSPETPHA